MVWGCMGWNGVGVLTEVQGIMNAEQYCEILDGGVVESFEKLEMPEGESVTYRNFAKTISDQLRYNSESKSGNT